MFTPLEGETSLFRDLRHRLMAYGRGFVWEVDMSKGTVKFFNSAKGFGFIAPEGGGGDVFVHVSALERSGVDALDEGDLVNFEVEEDPRSGKLAATDVEVLGKGAGGGGGRSRPPERNRGGFQPRDRGGPPRGGREPGESAGSGQGTVKWFNSAKGYGFIQSDSGGDDVFVHISAVEQAGLRELRDGQAVSYDLERDRRTGKLSAGNLRIMD